MGLSQNDVSIFTSVFYLGVAIGAILSGILSNIHGRKPALILGITIQIISGLFLALKLSFVWMCMFRTLYGIGFGSTLAVATIIATECLPMKYRGKGLLIINAWNSCGKVLGVALAFIFLENQEKKWS
jgi:MFS family permease